MRGLAKIFGFFFWLTPYFLRKTLAYSLAYFVYYGLRFREYTLRKNLHIAFPEKNRAARSKIILESLANEVLVLFEFFSIPWITQDFARTETVMHGEENLERAFALGRGVFMLSMHMGNGDLGCAILSLRGLKIHLISKKFKVKLLNDFWFGVRESMGTRFIDPHNPRNAFEIMGALKKNEMVGFVLDQYMGKPFGVLTRFFGKPVGTAYGLALYAKKTGAPVVPAFTYRDDKGQTHIVFEAIIETKWEEMEDNRDLQMQVATQQYNDWIESVVRRHPGQWMWIHRRWKKFK